MPLIKAGKLIALLKTFRIMFEIFERYLHDKIILTAGELNLIRSVTIEKRLKRKQFLLTAGEVCRQNCFVSKGCLRMYRFDENADEHMLRFAIENWWMSDRVSMTTGKPSLNYIDALEDCELLLWTKASFEMLNQEIPVFRQYLESMLARSFNASQERIYTNISATAEEKYTNFIKYYPHFFKRIPLHMIASYLGVSAKTLSRIRQHFAHSA
jgi:CRP-like cAMP-binding protein